MWFNIRLIRKNWGDVLASNHHSSSYSTTNSSLNRRIKKHSHILFSINANNSIYVIKCKNTSLEMLLKKNVS